MATTSDVAEQRHARARPANFTLDHANRCIWRDHDRLDLPPKAYGVLEYLRRNPGRLVSQDEILDHVWPNRFVQPEIVKTYIRTLRRLLDDDPRRPRFIETRPRSGYRFMGELPDRSSPPTTSLLVGRHAERDTLRLAVGRARAGCRGCIFITGEAGLGKSVLLEEFIAEVRTMSGSVVAVAYGAQSHGPPEPLSLVITLMQDLARTADSILFANSLEAHGPSWSRYVGRQAPGARQAPEASLAPPPNWLAGTLIREACAVLEHLAGQMTVVLAIDDLQWADAATIECLATLARRRYPFRILVVAAFRQVEFFERCPIRNTIDDLIAHERASELALPPLEPSEIARLLAPAAGADTLIVESGGNPLILRALVASAPHQSEAIRISLDGQLGATSPLLRDALEAGSIAGLRFCAWAVAIILDAEQARIEDLFARLALARQFLRLDDWYSLPDGSRTPIYAFKHPVHRRCLLDNQAPSRRSARSRKFGQAIVSLWGDDVRDVADDVSHCFKAAGDWSHAIAYTRLAADAAAERACPVEAVRLLTQALGLAAKLPIHERVLAQAPIRQDLDRLA